MSMNVSAGHRALLVITGGTSFYDLQCGRRRLRSERTRLCETGGLLGTFASNIGALLVSRVLIGIGTSTGYPTAMILIRERSEQANIGTPDDVLGKLSIAAQITAALGAPLGGVLVGVFGWRSIFLINVPLGIFTLLLTLVGVPSDGPPSERHPKNRAAAIDPLGIILFGITVSSLLVFLSNLAAPIWWLLPVFLVSASTMFVWERRCASPLIDMRIIASNPAIQRTYLRNGLTWLAIYGVLYGMSQWMEETAHLPAAKVGLILIPWAIVGAVVSAVVANNRWIRWPLILTGASIAGGGAVMLTLNHESSIWLVVATILLFGLTNGFGSIGNQSALYHQSRQNDIGVNSGLLRTSSYIGAIFSSSLISVAFPLKASDSGLHIIALVLGGIGLFLALFTTLDSTIRRSR